MTPSLRPAAATLALAVAMGLTASAYLKFGSGTGGSSNALRWTRLPARYFVTDRGVPGVSAADLASALDRAFAEWQAVESAAVTFERAGFTGAVPFEPEGMSVIGFDDRPDLERTLGATTYTYDTRTGEIVEADIFFNTAFAWSVTPGGETGRFDLESIAVHEIGHFVGLGHSAIGETEMRPGGGRRVIGAGAVLFPIAFSPGNIDGRALQADDIAGVSDIYPAGRFEDDTGSLAGNVTKNGRGVVGAHVVAFSVRTGRLVGSFTLTSDGRFTIAGLDPGPTVVRAEPLDDGDVESFLPDIPDVDIDFRVAFAPALVVVPQGGQAGGVQIAVEPK